MIQDAVIEVALECAAIGLVVVSVCVAYLIMERGRSRGPGFEPRACGCRTQQPLGMWRGGWLPPGTTSRGGAVSDRERIVASADVLSRGWNETAARELVDAAGYGETVDWQRDHDDMRLAQDAEYWAWIAAGNDRLRLELDSFLDDAWAAERWERDGGND